MLKNAEWHALMNMANAQTLLVSKTDYTDYLAVMFKVTEVSKSRLELGPACKTRNGGTRPPSHPFTLPGHAPTVIISGCLLPPAIPITQHISYVLGWAMPSHCHTSFACLSHSLKPGALFFR